MRIGHGYDVHRLAEGRKCIIGGVEIPFEKGLLGHSDADVLLHAVMDAVLGAMAAGDIGKLFPDNDPAYKGADSLALTRRVAEVMAERGYQPLADFRLATDLKPDTPAFRPRRTPTHTGDRGDRPYGARQQRNGERPRGPQRRRERR